MTQFSRMFGGGLDRHDASQGSEPVQSVGVVDGAIGGAERFASMAALFPDVRFEAIGPDWPQRQDPRLDVIIIGVSAASSEEVEAAIRLLRRAYDEGRREPDHIDPDFQPLRGDSAYQELYRPRG